MRWILGLTVAAMMMVGCAKPPDRGPGGLAKVRLALNWVSEPEFGGIYAARLIGAFARHGLEVEIEGGGSGAPVIQRVAAGQVEFGIASADEVIMARSRGADVVAIFATYQTSPQGIMVHESRALKSMGEIFQSGTMAIEPGLPYAAYLKNKYGFAGVRLVPYDGGIARFMADKAFAQQCFITSEPIAARKAGADPQVFLIADAGYDPYTAVVVTRGEVARQQSRMVHGMVEALREGWRAYLDDPKPANEFMGKLNPSMDAATFAAAAEAQKPLIETPQTKAAGLGTMTAQRWETLGKQLVDLKVIERAPAAAECFVK
jgi:NitT/TauT family transport system substrate-binding protein